MYKGCTLSISEMSIVQKSLQVNLTFSLLDRISAADPHTRHLHKTAKSKTVMEAQIKRKLENGHILQQILS